MFCLQVIWSRRYLTNGPVQDREFSTRCERNLAKACLQIKYIRPAHISWLNIDAEGQYSLRKQFAQSGFLAVQMVLP